MNEHLAKPLDLAQLERMLAQLLQPSDGGDAPCSPPSAVAELDLAPALRQLADEAGVNLAPALRRLGGHRTLLASSAAARAAHLERRERPLGLEHTSARVGALERMAQQVDVRLAASMTTFCDELAAQMPALEALAIRI